MTNTRGKKEMNFKIGIIFFSFLFASFGYSSEKEALLAIKGLGTNLKKELKKALKISAVNAVEKCKIKASKITALAAKKGITVGRVSRENRNPKNIPKEWMEKYIEAFHKKEIEKKYLTVSISKDKMGLLMPIKTMPVCLKCHGENISTGVSEKINSLYPKDKAVGYTVGQIRGFFWAEY